LNFEIETAIKALRAAGYYEHALYLAQKNRKDSWYLKILLEDLNNYQKALDYISTLDFYEAESCLKSYGKILVANLPQETTNLLMKLCSNYARKGEEASVATLPPEKRLKGIFI